MSLSGTDETVDENHSIFFLTMKAEFGKKVGSDSALAGNPMLPHQAGEIKRRASMRRT
jgi:hypothetical protein